MKRLSCILGLHEWQHQIRHEIIAETRYGWVFRVRHFEECSECDVTTPGRIQITHDLDTLHDPHAFKPSQADCDRAGCRNPARGPCKQGGAVFGLSQPLRKSALLSGSSCSSRRFSGADCLHK